MNYRRVLFITRLGDDPGAALALIHRVAPAAELLVVVARLGEGQFAWLAEEAPGDLHQAAVASLDSLRDAAAGAAARVQVELAPGLVTDELGEIVAGAGIDLLAAGPLPLSGISVLAELRKRHALAVLWTAGATPGDPPVTELMCVALGARERAAIASFLRDHGSPALHASVLLRRPPSAGTLAATLDMAGITARVDLVTLAAGSRPWRGGDQTGQAPADLLVLARFPGAPLRVAAWPAPPLILPPMEAAAPILRRALDVPDLVDAAGVIRARLDYASGVGRRDPIPDQQVAFISGGCVAAVITTIDGEGELPAGLDADHLGVCRVAENIAPDPLAVIEEQVAVIRPGSRPLLLFDAGLSDGDLGLLAGLAGAHAPDLLAVRLRATRSCAAIRARLRAAGLRPVVADASTVLDEGEALDVAEAVDAVRLARVGARMRCAGFPIVAIVHGGPHSPRTIGFAAVTATEAAASPWRLDAPVDRARSAAARLEATTGASLIAGNRIEIELDNARARRWLLDAIAASRERFHFQVYMAAGDDIGTEVEAALAAAGARGITVRVLVDSLHGFHGSYGVRNPLLDRLGKRPGVELRVSQPLTGLPSLEDLKQRDHRKIAVADGATGLIGGRNLSHEYYTGFHEVRLTPGSSWREVPWLDAGARVEGPAVAALERSFLEAWTGAGGSAFDIPDRPPAGDTKVRVVIHHGLQDATTLEAYLALIENAQSHVYTVNGFPLVLEIQHALLRARRRGVRVCTLIGHLTPTHGGKPFEGPWARARTAATELVDSRMDALVAAGAECYQFAVVQQPGWAPGLGTIHPHVHAKVMSADGRVCAVGSANLDITAGYWENELVLLAEDPAITAALEARIEELIAGSDRVDRNDPAWQATARHRRWLHHWPGVLSV
ncbi:MAG TPA: phosphatidylserine/phosphatidylglycerophosphate/cardiolipin synthase family protein [Gemmatimonadales bacterium]|nr:phosphatidylserine/phosphatidylglycerophosphate/cardiolipin synthase family protein [Gemmatimonadales bacterium]